MAVVVFFLHTMTIFIIEVLAVGGKDGWRVGCEVGKPDWDLLSMRDKGKGGGEVGTPDWDLLSMTEKGGRVRLEHQNGID